MKGQGGGRERVFTGKKREREREMRDEGGGRRKKGGKGVDKDRKGMAK